MYTPRRRGSSRPPGLYSRRNKREIQRPPTLGPSGRYNKVMADAEMDVLNGDGAREPQPVIEVGQGNGPQPREVEAVHGMEVGQGNGPQPEEEEALPREEEPLPREEEAVHVMEVEQGNRPQPEEEEGHGEREEPKTDQFYPEHMDKYVEKLSGNEEYACLHTGQEIYLKREGDGPYYARKVINVQGSNQCVEYAAKSGDKKPVYIKREGYTIFPMNLNENRPTFIKDPTTQDEVYPVDADTNEPYYPMDANGKEYYARDSKNDEFALSKLDSASGKLRPYYAKILGNGEIYPKKGNGDEYYLHFDKSDIPATKEIRGKVRGYYAKYVNTEEFYPIRFV